MKRLMPEIEIVISFLVIQINQCNNTLEEIFEVRNMSHCICDEFS